MYEALGPGKSAVSSSCIDAFLLRGGRTARAKLKIPVRVPKESICAVHQGSGDAKYLDGISLIIRGEGAVANRHLSECLVRSIRDIRDDERPSGGVAVVSGGDFRQAPPIVRQCSRAQVVAPCLKRAPIWRTMRRRVLTRNLRLLDGEGEFADYLIKIGDGSVAIVDGEDAIETPSEICTDSSLLDGPFGAIGRQVVPDIETTYGDEEYLLSGAVLTAGKAEVGRVNNALFRTAACEEFELKSVDSAAMEGEDGLFPLEPPNSLDISGPPPHTIRRKLGTPSMHLRNLNAERGMRNGSNAIVGRTHPRRVEAEVYTGKLSGSRVFIPRPLSIHRTPTCLSRRYANSSPCGNALQFYEQKSRGDTDARGDLPSAERVVGRASVRGA